MTRLVLTLWLLGRISAQAHFSRSELKKPFSEAVQKTLAEFVERWEACLGCNCVTKSHAFIATGSLSASCRLTPFSPVLSSCRIALYILAALSLLGSSVVAQAGKQQLSDVTQLSLEIVDFYEIALIGGLIEQKEIGRIPVMKKPVVDGGLSYLSCMWGRIKVEQIIYGSDIRGFEFVDVMWMTSMYSGNVDVSTSMLVNSDFLSGKKGLWLLTRPQKLENGVPLVFNSFVVLTKSSEMMQRLSKSKFAKDEPRVISPKVKTEGSQPLAPPPP